MSQTDVQQLIQGLAPGSVNNGNPNTIYNTPGTPMQPPQSRNPAWAQGMPPIPQSTAFGEWMLPGNWQAPYAPEKLNLPQWVLPQVTSNPTPGGQTPGTPSPTVPGTTGGAGNNRPDPVTGLPGPQSPTTPPTNGNGTITDPNTLFNNFKGQMGDAMGEPGTPQWNRNVEWFKASAERMEGLKKADGTYDWKQLLDMVTEPWLSGNVWLSGSQKWDASNAIAGVVQGLTGLPLNNIMNMLGEMQATGEDPVDNWMEKMLSDHWEDNANNEIKVFQQTLNNYLSNWADHKTDSATTNNTNYNSNWMDIYNRTYVDNLLAGMTPAQANAAAKDSATKNATNAAPKPTAGEAPRPTTDASGRELGYGISRGPDDQFCVVVDSVLETHERAGDVKVGDTMKAINAITFEQNDVTVSHSQPQLQPCVRLTTKNGVVLECSRSAPIADDTGDQVPAEDLLGYSVPVCVNGMIDFDTVMTVEDIGEKWVQHITCENNFFLAGKEKGKYLLHHNAKYMNQYGNRTTSSGWQGSGSITPNGLLWGW